MAGQGDEGGWLGAPGIGGPDAGPDYRGTGAGGPSGAQPGQAHRLRRRRRRRARQLRAAAAVVIVAAAAGVVVALVAGRHHPPRPDPTAAAYLAAWSRQDWAAMQASVDRPPAYFVAVHQAMVSDLEVTAASYQPGAAHVHGALAEVPYTARLTLNGLGVWQLPGTLHLRRAGIHIPPHVADHERAPIQNRDLPKLHAPHPQNRRSASETPAARPLGGH